MTKTFKYTIKTTKGMVLYESHVTFGSEDHPFPDNLEEDIAMALAIEEHKDVVLKKVFDVTVDENLEFELGETPISASFGTAGKALAEYRTLLALQNLGYEEGSETDLKIKEIERVAKWLNKNA